MPGASADLAAALLIRGVIDGVYAPSLEAQRALEDAYGMVQATRSEHLVPLALTGLGIVAYELRQYVEAERYFKECATLARQRRSLRYSGMCLRYLGDIARGREQYEKTARHYYHEGLADLRGSGGPLA